MRDWRGGRGTCLDLRDRLELLEVVALAVGEVACGAVSLSASWRARLHVPLLWYIGSAMGPARSKTWVDGKPCSWKLCSRVSARARRGTARHTHLVVAAARGREADGELGAIDRREVRDELRDLGRADAAGVCQHGRRSGGGAAIRARCTRPGEAKGII